MESFRPLAAVLLTPRAQFCVKLLKMAATSATSKDLGRLAPLCDICRAKGIKAAAKVIIGLGMKEDSLGNPGYFWGTCRRRDLSKSERKVCESDGFVAFNDRHLLLPLTSRQNKTV